MACGLKFEHSPALAFLGNLGMDRQRLPVSKSGAQDEGDVYPNFAEHAEIRGGGRQNDDPDESRECDRERLSHRHYVSNATTETPQFSREGLKDGFEDLEDEDFKCEEEDKGRESEGEEKPSRTRDKNRRAQQRFRQRQKAKLQAKEQETLQLKRQVQELQDQLVALQVNGAGPFMKQQMQQIQSQCQILQSENSDIRALAMLYMDENARLHNDLKQQLVPLASPLYGNSTHAAGLSNLLLQKQLRDQPNPMSLPFSHQPESTWLDIVQGSKQMEPNMPRLTVFKNLHQVPWQVAPHLPENGLPAGCYPGRTQMCILIKMLSRTRDGSCTVLVKFPPGFMHDYVISSEDQVEEGIILEGSLTDTVLHQTFYTGDYCRILPGHRHGPYRADSAEGALCYMVTRKGK